MELCWKTQAAEIAESNCCASGPQGALSRSVISWQGSGAMHLLLEEAGTAQLLICEGKRAEGTGTRRLRVPSKDHMLAKPRG